MAVVPESGVSRVWMRQPAAPTESTMKLPSSIGPVRPTVLKPAASINDCTFVAASSAEAPTATDALTGPLAVSVGIAPG
jgi:hypothetical protein